MEGDKLYIRKMTKMNVTVLKKNHGTLNLTQWDDWPYIKSLIKPLCLRKRQ